LAVTNVTNIRDAVVEDLHPLAELRRQGWREAHAEILPQDLARLRTLQSFTERLSAAQFRSE
jgi:hypothetical protein